MQVLISSVAQGGIVGIKKVIGRAPHPFASLVKRNSTGRFCGLSSQVDDRLVGHDSVLLSRGFASWSGCVKIALVNCDP
jgi:hypothetical protein